MTDPKRLRRGDNLSPSTGSVPAPWPPYRGDPADLIDHERPGIDALLALLDRLRPDWHAQAACAGTPTELWFPSHGGATTATLAICQRCPVRFDCLDEAVADPALDHGFRGGLSATARRRLRAADPPEARS